MSIYKIRFNYKYLPYIWLRVPKFIWALTRSSKLYIDSHYDSGRKPITQK